MRPERLAAFLCAALFARGALAGFAANGVALGASEQAVSEHFPNAHCQALQWQSRAADRRCDDSRVTLEGIEARITLYLKHGSVEGIDVRFATSEVQRFAKLLAERYGMPAKVEDTEKAHTLRWREQREHALLSTQAGQRHASLIVWRGDFYDEIYKVR